MIGIRYCSLDRILEMEQTDLPFEYPQTFNPKVYFDNSFGVIVDEEYDVEKISIKVYGNQCKYFRSLPLHHSQKESETHSNYSIFNYRLRPTYDFCHIPTLFEGLYTIRFNLKCT